MERLDSSVSDMVEVDIGMDGELDDFASTPPPRSANGGARASAAGAVWLFSLNALLPLVIASLTTANALVVSNNGTLLPWLDDGHNIGLLHASMFVVVLGLWFAVTSFHRRARAQGYLTFYRTTRSIKDAPLLAIGVGNGKNTDCDVTVCNMLRPFVFA